MESWKVALFVASLVATVVCIAPSSSRSLRRIPGEVPAPDRPLLLFWATAAFALGSTFIARLSAIGALQALGDTPFG